MDKSMWLSFFGPHCRADFRTTLCEFAVQRQFWS